MPTIANSRGPAASLLLLLVASCAAAPAAPPRVATAPPPTVAPQPRVGGLVVGQTARELQSAFGMPSSVLAEGIGRRLQFAGATCVLDAYLYPDGGREPSVTHIDTRRPTGEDIDRAACVAALRQRL